MRMLRSPYANLSPQLQKWANKMREIELAEEKAQCILYEDDDHNLIHMDLKLFEEASWINAAPLLAKLPHLASELIHLILEIGPISEFPLWIADLKKLNTVYLHFPKVISLPQKVNLFPPKISSLDFLLGVSSLPSDFFTSVPKLQTLFLKMPELQTIPSGIGELSELSYFSIKLCSSLSGLPYSIGQLQNLKKLECHNSGIVSLPESLANNKMLELFKVTQCPRLKSLPDALGALPALRDVWVADCPSLTALPLSLPDAPRLHRVNIDSCRKLKGAPAFGDRWERVPVVLISNCGRDWERLSHAR